MRLQRILTMGLIFGLTMGLGGCASSGDSSSSSGSSTTEKAQPAQVPANSKLAKIDLGMSDLDVRKILGNPDNQRSYPTGKNWIPFYFGGDTYRTDWIYSGVGRVILGNSSRFSPAMKVVELRHNPQEP